METIIAIIVIFGLLVFIHEWGHLYFAKRAGILCREFAIGMGPKLFSFKKGETLYTIRLLPIGGFVRMAGEEPEIVTIKPGYEIAIMMNEAGKVSQLIVNNKSKYPLARRVTVEYIDLEKELILEVYENDERKIFHVDEKAHIIYDGEEIQIAPLNRQFHSKTVGQRALAIFAGPFMNFVLAFVILTVFAVFAGTPVERAQLGMLTPDGRAQEAGLKENDRIVSINGEEVETWDDFTSIIQQNPNKELLFEVERNGETLFIPVVPEERIGADGEKEGFIGVWQATQFSLTGSLKFGLLETYTFTKLIFQALGTIVTGNFTLDDLAGPVGIYTYTDQAAEMGLLVLMRWAAILSVNLGIINLLPLPALDGGRLLFIGIEAIRGKPIDPQKESLVHIIGFALLMLLMLVVTWNDINRLFL